MEKLGSRLLQIATMVHRGTRRFTQVSTSDDDEAPPPPPSSSTEEEPKQKRKKLKHHEEEKEEKEHPQSDEDETVQEDAKPVGEVVRVSGKGRGKKNHYKAMEYDGNRFDLVSFDDDLRLILCVIKPSMLLRICFLIFFWY